MIKRFSFFSCMLLLSTVVFSQNQKFAHLSQSNYAEYSKRQALALQDTLKLDSATTVEVQRIFSELSMGLTMPQGGLIRSDKRAALVKKLLAAEDSQLKLALTADEYQRYMAIIAGVKLKAKQDIKE